MGHTFFPDLEKKLVEKWAWKDLLLLHCVIDNLLLDFGNTHLLSDARTCLGLCLVLQRVGCACTVQLVAAAYFPWIPFLIAFGGSERRRWSQWDCLRKELVMAAFPVELFPFYSYSRPINTWEKAGELFALTDHMRTL